MTRAVFNAMMHQLFHLFTSRWYYDLWRAGPIRCETRTCSVCWRSQFRSDTGLGGRMSSWIETTEQPAEGGRARTTGS